MEEFLPDVVFKGDVTFDDDGYYERTFRKHGDSYDQEIAVENLQNLIDNFECMENFESLFPIEISLNPAVTEAKGKEGSGYKVTSINSYAFSYHGNLTSISIPDGVTNIGKYAFWNCENLTSISIPDGVTGIDSGAFLDCENLTSMTIPKSVTSIGGSLLGGCTSLTSVEVDKDNTTYHSSGNCIIETASKTLVAGCDNSVIPNDGSVTKIGASAFSGCTGLTSITIPNSVTGIGTYAFSSCTGLTSITIPSSVTSIGTYAFAGCTGLQYKEAGLVYISTTDNEYYYLQGTESDYLDSTAIINENCKFVGSSAFCNCTSLTSITIPSSVKSIGSYAFEDCLHLESVTFEDPTGWFVASSSSATSGTSLTLTSHLTNATYLSKKYVSRWWIKSA